MPSIKVLGKPVSQCHLKCCKSVMIRKPSINSYLWFAVFLQPADDTTWQLCKVCNWYVAECHKQLIHHCLKLKKENNILVTQSPLVLSIHHSNIYSWSYFNTVQTYQIVSVSFLKGSVSHRILHFTISSLEPQETVIKTTILTALLQGH